MHSMLNPPPEIEYARLTHGVFEDFNHYTTAEDFTTVASDSGTIAHTDAAGGVIQILPSDSSRVDNDETYLKGTAETFKFANNKPIFFEALVQFTEAATDDANVIVGLKDAVAADTLLDDGGGPAASYSGVVFFKVDGGTKWNVESSLAGTQITTLTEVTAGGAAYQRLRIEVIPVSSTIAEVTFFIDGVACRDANGVTIKHSLTYTSATEMQICIGMKQGSSTVIESLLVDYVMAFQKRN